MWGGCVHGYMCVCFYLWGEENRSYFFLNVLLREELSQIGFNFLNKIIQLSMESVFHHFSVLSLKLFAFLHSKKMIGFF